MRKTIAIIGGLGLAIQLVAVTAMASETEISELSTKRNTTLSVAQGDYAVSGITSVKHEATPCYLSITERALNGSGGSSEKNGLNACPDRLTRDEKTVKFDNPNLVVRGITTCLSKGTKRAKARLAGIQLSAADISNGSATPAGSDSDAVIERSGCTNWQQPVFCPDGEVATGLNVHFRRAHYTDFEIVGLGSICEPLGA